MRDRTGKSHRTMRHAAALALALACGHAAAQVAATSIPPFACRSHPGFDSDQVPVAARVLRTPTGRTHFHDDRAGCPAEDGCRRKAYLVEGDDVIVDRVAGEWACAWFPGKRGTTMGYVRADDLALEPAAVESDPDEWVGHWVEVGEGDVAEADFVDLDRRGDMLVASGQALWFGVVVDGDRVVHEGGIEDEILAIDGTTASFAAEGEYDCAATFRLVGPWLLVDDNGYCGGMNVTFDGIYRRVAPAKDTR